MTDAISKNFTFSEFIDSEVARKNGIDNTPTDLEVRDNIVALVRRVLQPLRSRWGEPLHVNSGYRCPQLNALVGGVPTSQHTKGEAADIKAKNPFELAQCALSMGLPFDQMILYPTFVHFSHKRTGRERNQVLYSSTYRGKKF